MKPVLAGAAVSVLIDQLGQLDGSYTLKVEDLIHEEKDLIDDLRSR